MIQGAKLLGKDVGTSESEGWLLIATDPVKFAGQAGGRLHALCTYPLDESSSWAVRTAVSGAIGSVVASMRSSSEDRFGGGATVAAVEERPHASSVPVLVALAAHMEVLNRGGSATSIKSCAGLLEKMVSSVPNVPDETSAAVRLEHIILLHVL